MPDPTTLTNKKTGNSSPPQIRTQQLEEKLSEIKIKEIEEKAKTLAESTNLPFLDLTVIPIDKPSLYLLKESQSKEAGFVVVERSGKTLKAGAVNPLDPKVTGITKSLEADGYSVKLFVISKRGLDRALEGYKELKEFEKVKLGIVKISEGNISSVQKDIQNIQDIRKKLGKVTITELIEVLLAGALKIEASDIHFEPEEKSIRLRYRVDGILQDIMDVELQNYVQILNRLKIVSGLKINIHEAPQDGRFTIRMEDVDIEIRVSILPGGYGENIVMRILDPRTIKQGIEELGMRQDLLEEMKKQLKKTTGAILTTGPTGSGKTTTLYAFLQYVNEEGTKIITIEDPIEYHIKGISQTQTEPEKGYTFANGLRAIVRQDPDVVLIGEIRDVETAEIALHAALTGHLVFSTLHTNDSAGTIPRLIDLGVKPQIIAPALNVAMAQRLIRQLCKECKKIDKPTAEQLQRIKIALASLPKKVSTKKMEDNLKIFNPVGCNKCNNTGYKGRIGIFEAFIINDDIEKLILGSPAISEVRELAIKNGMVTMLQDGYLKVLEGITDMVEVERVTGL